MTVRLYSANKNEYKESNIGFSWTTLIFGFLVPLLRGDEKWAIIQFVLAIITHGLSWFVMPIFYNEWYIKDLIKKGYLPADDKNARLLVQNFLITAETLAFLSREEVENTDEVEQTAHVAGVEQ